MGSLVGWVGRVVGLISRLLWVDAGFLVRFCGFYGWFAILLDCCLDCLLFRLLFVVLQRVFLVCCISCGVGIIQILWLGWIGGLCCLGGLTCGDLWLVPPRWFG